MSAASSSAAAAAPLTAAAASSESSPSASPPRRVRRTDEEILSHTQLISWDGPAFTAPAVLPTRQWWPLAPALQSHRCRNVIIKHGSVLQRLEVRVLYGSWQPANASKLKELLDWLCADNQSHRHLLGMDAESGETGVRWVQLSTATRCVLLQLPKQSATLPSPRALSATAPSPLPPSMAPLRELLADRSWSKSGAELWTDALELFGACDRMCTNGCLDVSVSHCAPNGDSISLLDMCDRVVGVDAFRKDRKSSCSNWDAEPLSLRQIIYAALDAQSSYALAAFSEDRGVPLPAPIHLSDLPQSWLAMASHWRRLQRLEEVESRKQLEVAYYSVTISSKQRVTVHMKAYASRVRPQSLVTFHWKDGKRNKMKVINVYGQTAQMEFQDGGDDQSRSRRPEDIEKIMLDRSKEEDIFRKAAQKYFSAFMHGSEQAVPSPFVNALLQLHGVTATESAASESIQCEWWNRPMAVNSVSYKQLDCFQALNASQRVAIELTDRQRITIVQGPPGTGKTKTIAVEAHRSGQRLSSIPGASAEEKERATRVLCVAETNTAARHMAESIVKLGVSPSDLQLVVSNEYECEWHNKLYDRLVADGYMAELAEQRNTKPGKKVKPVSEKAANASKHCRILISTIGKVYGASMSNCDRFQRRPTLIVDEASQVWDLKALLLLRRLPHTERLLLFGDDKQLAPYVARQEANSVLDAASAVSSSACQLQSASCGFRVKRTMLTTQYRMPLHLGGMISQLFYDGKLSSHKDDPDPCIEFEHVEGNAARDGTSQYNPSEANRISKRWLHLTQNSGYKPHDIVVLCFYEAQRKYVADRFPGMRCFNVDSFQGQEAPVILLTLSAPKVGAFLGDARRVNVACSRAQERLIIFGNIKQLRKSDTVWQRISMHLPPDHAAPSDEDARTAAAAAAAAASSSPTPVVQVSQAHTPSVAAAASSPPPATPVVAQARTPSVAASPAAPSVQAAAHTHPPAVEASAPASADYVAAVMGKILRDGKSQLELTSLGDKFKMRFGRSFHELKLGTLLSFLRSRPAEFRLHEPAEAGKQWRVSSSNGTAASNAAASNSATQPLPKKQNACTTAPMASPTPTRQAAAALPKAAPARANVTTPVHVVSSSADALLDVLRQVLHGRGPKLLSWLGAQRTVRNALTSRRDFSWKPFIDRHPTLLRHSLDAAKQTLVEWIGGSNIAVAAAPVDCLAILRHLLQGHGPKPLTWVGEQPAVARADFKRRLAGWTLLQFVETHPQRMRLTRNAKKHTLVEWIEPKAEANQAQPLALSGTARPAPMLPVKGHWSPEMLRDAFQQLLQSETKAVPLEWLASRFHSSRGRSLRQCSDIKLPTILKQNPSIFAVTTSGGLPQVQLCSGGATSSSSTSASARSPTTSMDEVTKQLAAMRLKSPPRMTAPAPSAPKPAPQHQRAPSASAAAAPAPCTSPATGSTNPASSGGG